MKFKLLCAIAALSLFIVPICLADSAAAPTKTLSNKLERYVYGETQPGNLTSRLKQLEEDLFGRTTGRTDTDRAKFLNDFIFRGTANSPSLDMKLSYLEWRIFNQTGQGPLERRLSALDTQIVGLPSNEPLAFRLEQLVHLSIEDGLVAVQPVKLARGTEIKLRLTEPISSKTAQRGDIAQFVAVNDFFVKNNVLVMTQGGIITGKVRTVRRGGRFGRSGFVSLIFDQIESMDSTPLPVEISESGQESFDKRKLGMAVGASTVGYFVLGPLGVAGGAFIKGEDVDIPSGTEITVRLTKDMQVMGVIVPRR